jgi:hypothetical protein
VPLNGCSEPLVGYASVPIEEFEIASEATDAMHETNGVVAIGAAKLLVRLGFHQIGATSLR